jgi:hypothetical protein
MRTRRIWTYTVLPSGTARVQDHEIVIPCDRRHLFPTVASTSQVKPAKCSLHIAPSPNRRRRSGLLMPPRLGEELVRATQTEINCAGEVQPQSRATSPLAYLPMLTIVPVL